MLNYLFDVDIVSLFVLLVVPSIAGTLVYLVLLKKKCTVFRSVLLFFISSLLLSNVLSIFTLCIIRNKIDPEYTTYSGSFWCFVFSLILNIIISVLIGKKQIHMKAYEYRNVSNINGSIEFWRIAFSIIILLFHGHCFISDSIPFSSGRFAVEFFFIVTGFLFAKSTEKYVLNRRRWEDAGGFLFNRWKRFYPETIVSICISFLVIHIRSSELGVKTVFLDAIKSVFQALLIWMSGLNLYAANNVTWYLSVVFISTVVLFPIMVANHRLFLDILAPLIAMFCLGSLCIKYGKLVGYSDDMIFSLYRGIVRGIGEISLGCFCFSIFERIDKFQFTKAGRILLAIIELTGYLFTIYWIKDHNSGKMDFVLLLMVSISILISFTGKSSISGFFQKDFIIWLGRFSFPVYLGHTYWAQSLIKFFPEMKIDAITSLYIVISIMTAVTIMTVSQTIRDYRVFDRSMKRIVAG